MGLAEFNGHCEFVIKVGKGAVGVFGAGIEDGLGCLLDFGFLGVGGCRPGEVVVNDGIRITSTTNTRPTSTSRVTQSIPPANASSS